MILLIEYGKITRTDFPRIDITRDYPKSHVIKYLFDKKNYDSSISNIIGYLEFPDKSIKKFEIDDMDILSEKWYFTCPVIDEIINHLGNYKTWVSFKYKENHLETKKYEFSVHETDNIDWCIPDERYNEVLMVADDAKRIAQELRKEADSGVFDGKPGETGPQGPQGEAASVTIGTVTTGEPGSSAEVTNSGTSENAVLDFVIPQGPQGNSATIQVGTVTTGEPGTQAQITNSGTSQEVVLDFVIPQGPQGTVGPEGPIGAEGQDGVSPTITTETFSGGTRVIITDASGAHEFDVMNGQNGAPGEKGDPGEHGADGQDGQNGQDGITPTIGENGNWFLGDIDTGKPSRGEIGLTGPQGPEGPAGQAGPQGPEGQDAPQIDDTQITNSNPWSSQKIIDTLCPSFTVTGDFAVFTPVEGYALNVNAEISLEQEGTGTPSAENIRPIIGKNAVNLYHGGINLADILNAQILYNNDSSKFAPQPRPDFTDGKIICGISGSNYWNPGLTDEWTVHSDGSISYYFRANAYGFGYVTSVLPGRTYTFSYSSPKSFFVYALGIDENGNVSVNSGGGTGYSLTATAAETDKYLLFLISLHGLENAGLYTIQNFQITGGSVQRNYEIFNPDSSQITTTLPKTIYGGTLDMVSGEGQETWGYIPSYNGEMLPGEWISDRDAYVPGAVPTTGAQVAYALSQPVSFSVDPQPITGLSGTNMIFSDTGTVTVSGKSDPESVIQQLYDRISALESDVTNL